MLFPELKRNEINSLKATSPFFLGLLRRIFLTRSHKVFVIGFHKTGTSSIGKALQILGYKVCGSLKDIDFNEINYNSYEEGLEDLFSKCKKELIKFNAFQDTPWFLLYEKLYYEYPNAKFILTVRDKEKWIKSVQKHFGVNSFKYHHFIYGTNNPLLNEEIYKQVYHNHYETVRLFFKAKRANLLEIDIEQEDKWSSLCKFLEVSKPLAKFPYVNKASYRRSAITRLKMRIKKIYYK